MLSSTCQIQWCTSIYTWYYIANTVWPENIGYDMFDNQLEVHKGTFYLLYNGPHNKSLICIIHINQTQLKILMPHIYKSYYLKTIEPKPALLKTCDETNELTSSSYSNKICWLKTTLTADLDDPNSIPQITRKILTYRATTPTY